MQFVARVRYGAPSNKTWGENEIDYIVLLPLAEEPQMTLNDNEVSESRLVTPSEMRAMLDADDVVRCVFGCDVQAATLTRQNRG